MKRYFFKNIQNNRKHQIVFFLICMCIILGGYGVLHYKIAKEKSEQYTVTADKNLIKYIENVSVDGNKLKVSGWCFYKGSDSQFNTIQVLLRNLKDKEDVVWLDVERINREDIDVYYDSDVNYEETGFEASTKLSKLDINEKNYEVFLKLGYVVESVKQTDEGEELVKIERTKTVSTGRYIADGKLTALNDEKYKPAETTSGLLKEVFEQGELLVYQKEADMYVYQHDGKLYWVAGRNFYFEEDGTTKIQFQLGTTRADRLPVERQENGHDWDNISFVFEKREVTQDPSGTYRVAEYDIPIEYPITCFWTGYYADSEWHWREDVNLNISTCITK